MIIMNEDYFLASAKAKAKRCFKDVSPSALYRDKLAIFFTNV